MKRKYNIENEILKWDIEMRHWTENRNKILKWDIEYGILKWNIKMK